MMNSTSSYVREEFDLDKHWESVKSLPALDLSVSDNRGESVVDTMYPDSYDLSSDSRCVPVRLSDSDNDSGLIYVCNSIFRGDCKHSVYQVLGRDCAFCVNTYGVRIVDRPPMPIKTCSCVNARLEVELTDKIHCLM